jgi:pimeloyl-ACP methyl ester carboxylesterase
MSLMPIPSVQKMGQGPPILFLHGWGADSRSFGAVGQALARQGFACHLLDLPGFGGTPPPDETWDVPRYAAWVSAYMQAEGLASAHIVGHSFGGRISLVLGADYPHLVQKLVLVDSAGLKLPPSAKMRLYQVGRSLLLSLLRLPFLRRYEDRGRAYLRRRFGSEDYKNAGVLSETFKQVIAQDLLPYARRVAAPTLLIWGADDKDTPLKMGQILEKNMPNAGLVVFEGTGHYAHVERPSQFVHIVSHFLGQTSA